MRRAVPEMLFDVMRLKVLSMRRDDLRRPT
jgi:hypothetical protein